MGEVLAFPKPSNSDWKKIEATLRSATAGQPGDVGVWDACLKEVKEYWAEMFATLTIEVPVEVKAQFTPSQDKAIQAGIDAAVHSLVNALKEERAKHFGLVARLVYERTQCELAAGAA